MNKITFIENYVIGINIPYNGIDCVVNQFSMYCSSKNCWVFSIEVSNADENNVEMIRHRINILHHITIICEIFGYNIHMSFIR